MSIEDGNSFRENLPPKVRLTILLFQGSDTDISKADEAANQGDYHLTRTLKQQSIEIIHVAIDTIHRNRTAKNQKAE